MILTDTLNQPKALAIYTVLGIIFGIFLMLNVFTCKYLIKSPYYRHISQTLYVFIYGLVFFAVTYTCFDYDLKIYHLLISAFFTALTSLILYLPIKRHDKTIATKCNAFRLKVSQSKAIQRFKK